MTEPQDVLAEALHDAIIGCDWNDAAIPKRRFCEDDFACHHEHLSRLAARGYALVRTPETLDESAVRRLLTTLAAAQSPAPPEGLHDEFAWLIERGQPEKQVPTVWWADRKRWGLAHMDEWTEDANKAYRFASKAEAEDYIERHSPIPSHRPRLGRAVEHGFLAPPAPDPGAELREALEEQWLAAHADHCDSVWPHPDHDCRWPRPAALSPSAEPPETET